MGTLTVQKGTMPKKGSKKGTLPKKGSKKGTLPKKGSTKGMMRKKGSKMGTLAKKGSKRGAGTVMGLVSKLSALSIMGGSSHNHRTIIINEGPMKGTGVATRIGAYVVTSTGGGEHSSGNFVVWRYVPDAPLALGH